MRRHFPVLAFVLLAAVPAGCTHTTAPPLAYPAHIFGVCGAKEPRVTGILSVVTSTDEVLHPDDRQTDATVRRLIRRTGGVIAYWNDQLLLLPKTAAALGESDDYVHLRAAAITAVPDGLTKHRIYLEVSDHGVKHWIALDAYDVQNPCVEGHLSM